MRKSAWAFQQVPGCRCLHKGALVIRQARAPGLTRRAVSAPSPERKAGNQAPNAT